MADIFSMEKAWSCVLDQYFAFACNKSMIEGKGINVFTLLKKEEEGCNCHYFYSKTGGSAWDDILSSQEDGEWILQKLDPDRMILICIRISPNQSKLHSFDDRMECSLKLFDIDSKKEILKKEIPPKEISKKETGLRKRKV